MIKRLLITGLLVVVGLGLFTILYKQFNNSTLTAQTAFEPDNLSFDYNSIPYKELSGHLKAREGKTLLFVSSQNEDALYIEQSVLAPLLNEFESPISVPILQVAMDDSMDASVVSLQKSLGIETFPSYVLVESANDSYQVLSTLSFKSDEPLNAEDLKSWLFKNELWSGPYGKN